jgi:hypothetical protein
MDGRPALSLSMVGPDSIFVSCDKVLEQKRGWDQPKNRTADSQLRLDRKRGTNLQLQIPLRRVFTTALSTPKYIEFSPSYFSLDYIVDRANRGQPPTYINIRGYLLCDE